MADRDVIRVIVDVQVLQTSDRRRGMGLYLRSLLKSAHLRHANSPIEWCFILNGQLSALSKEDDTLLQDIRGKRLSLNLRTQTDVSLFDEAADENRRTVDHAVASLPKNVKKTIFFMPAMFSREIYPVFPARGTVNIMLFHDLIPFLFHENYFADHEGIPRKDYAQRFREVYKTDLFVTNSQTTADDLTVYFGVDPSRIVPIFGAAAERKGLHSLRPKIADKLEKGFILMPSGDDFRKNNELAVKAFAEMHREEKLVITSTFSQGSKRTLREICPDVVFSETVTDEEFLWLVDNAKAIFFPTLYEGLGMPVLEAIERNAKVACSSIPVFAELSQTAFYFFDPQSTTSMAQTLLQVLGDSEADHQVWEAKRSDYSTVLSTFSWEKTADLFIDALLTCGAPLGPKQKIAVFCPSPSSYSSVGKYAFEVHAELSRIYDIDYYVGEGQTEFKPTRPNILEYAANYFPADSFSQKSLTCYKHLLYNIGNSEFHIEAILNALRFPGSVIVHDTKLNGIFDYMQHWGFMPVARREFETLLDERFNCKHSSCLASLLANQKGVFCHSTYAKKAIQEVVAGSSPRLNQIVHPIGVPAIELMRPAGFTVSFAGIISEDKGISLVADVSKITGTHVKVFGFGVLGDSPLLQGLGENVEITHDLTDKSFQDLLRSSDVVVNYRPNYHGETSRSTLEAMRYGAVVIVKKVGWYDELPDEVVIKVESEAEVLVAVQRLAQDPKIREKIGSAARKFLTEHYGYGDYAQSIATALQEE